jgi:hypothetical protein
MQLYLSRFAIAVRHEKGIYNVNYMIHIFSNALKETAQSMLTVLAIL